MKKEILDIVIKEILTRTEEIRRLEIKDRLAYIGFLIHDISGIPAIYLHRKDANYILDIIRKEVRLSDSLFS